MSGINLVSLAARVGWMLLLHFAQNKKIKKRSVARSRDVSFDTAFRLIKKFLRQATEGTVEDLQSFCNIHIPSPSWSTVVAVKIPLEMADQAAKILIEHIGAETMDALFGGQMWWQQRAQGYIAAEWIAAKRDWDLANEARLKENHQNNSPSDSAPNEPAAEEQTCMFYMHGGGFYFGSLNTHRYSIWRMATKAGARAFAVSYRLSPQYPFPCALQDCLAAYLYLIRPPEGAEHKPVNPARIILAGDSAGGNICLALLCLLRDAGLPLPAGAMLLSPWTELCESFPSVMTNADTDVIPPHGFIHKPSTLWPPLPPEDRQRVDTFLNETSTATTAESIQRKATQAKREADRQQQKGTMATRFPPSSYDIQDEITSDNAKGPSDLGQKTEPDAPIMLEIDGQKVEFRDQLHLYATNIQLSHPLVSPALQPSLAGLPPLYIMCGDGEVLRDEIVYTAHRAAHPDQYPLRKALLSRHENEKRVRLAKNHEPTNVHLQIYDGMCHDLPLFAFIPPARYCYRAIASFCKSVTSPTFDLSANSVPEQTDPVRASAYARARDFTRGMDDSEPMNALSEEDISQRKLDRLKETIYSSSNPFHRPAFENHMIRERVSVRGVIRDLEPASDIDALQLDPDNIGLLREQPVKRYLQGRQKWDERFVGATKKVRKDRRKQILRAANMERKRRLSRGEDGKFDCEHQASTSLWHLPGESEERPPPSSIAARKDTKEALRLASLSSEHRSFATHPLKLWIELQNSTWLKQALARNDHQQQNGSEDDASSVG